MTFVLPIPTPSIFMISSPTLIKSDPKNEVIPLNLIKSSVVKTWSAKVVVTDVATTGDWMILSKASSALAFWFLAINLWDVPIPTWVISNVSGTIFKAFSALDANLTLSSLTLTMKIFSGSLSVLPTPTNVVVPIPIDWVVPAPAWIYFTLSPVTKKWFGSLIVLLETLTIDEALPTNSLAKIGSFLCLRSNALLIDFSVPS